MTDVCKSTSYALGTPIVISQSTGDALGIIVISNHRTEKPESSGSTGTYGNPLVADVHFRNRHFHWPHYSHDLIQCGPDIPVWHELNSITDKNVWSAIPKSWLPGSGALPHRTRCPGVRSFSSVRCPALQRRGIDGAMAAGFRLLLAMNCQVAAEAADGTEVPYSGAPAVQEKIRVGRRFSSPPGNELPGCR